MRRSDGVAMRCDDVVMRGVEGAVGVGWEGVGGVGGGSYTQRASMVIRSQTNTNLYNTKADAAG